MAANEDFLGLLHDATAQALMNKLKGTPILDEDGNETGEVIPPSAADIQAAAKFLKDNNITCDPTDVGDIEALREQFQAQLKTKRKLHTAVELAAEDIEALYH